MSFLIVIPARYASTRYPGKPLVPLIGATGKAKTLLQRSWEAATAVGGDPRVVVATDDGRIRDVAEGFGAEVVMTSEAARNGTERVAEAYEVLGDTYDVVVNLQGDAPLTPPWFVEDLVASLRAAPDAQVATPVLRTDGAMLKSLQADRKADRVGGTTAVFDSSGYGLYFSKEVIPFTAEAYADNDETPVWHHVGCYAYKPAALMSYPSWPVGTLEALEGLEQLRFLERGTKVTCVKVEARGRDFWELNNPADVSKIEEILTKQGFS